MTERRAKRTIEIPLWENTTIEIYNPQLTPWTKINRPVVAIDRTNLQERGLGSEVLKQRFTDPRNTNALLLSSKGSIIGYAIARPIGDYIPKRAKENVDTAYLSTIALHLDVQKKGLSTKLLDGLEKELRKKGYLYLELEARIVTGFANKLEERYEGLIEKQGQTYNISLGEFMRFFRVRLYA